MLAFLKIYLHMLNCRILALRICELDSAVQSPTTKLLEGYTSANVDLRCMYNQTIIIIAIELTYNL